MQDIKIILRGGGMFFEASRCLVKPDHHDYWTKYDVMSIKEGHGDQMNLGETV